MKCAKKNIEIEITKISKEIDETSALEIINGNFLTLNDSGDDPLLYIFDKNATDDWALGNDNKYRGLYQTNASYFTGDMVRVGDAIYEAQTNLTPGATILGALIDTTQPADVTSKATILQEIYKLDKTFNSIEGKKGTTFLCDVNSIIHRANQPKVGQREAIIFEVSPCLRKRNFLKFMNRKSYRSIFSRFKDSAKFVKNNF